MPQDIKTGSVYNTQVPTVIDTADIVAALTNYHYGVTDGVAPADTAIVSGANGIAGLFKSKASLDGPTFTGTVVLPSTTSIGTVTSAQIGYLSGVTSAIQTQLDTKAPKASPTFTGTVIFNGTTRGPTTNSVTLFYQPATVAKSSSVTLDMAEMLKSLILVSGSGNKTLTLPLGTDADAALTSLLGSAAPTRTAFDWNIVNTSGGGITVRTNTAHSINGSTTLDVLLMDGSGRFRTVKTGTGTFATYWLGR